LSIHQRGPIAAAWTTGVALGIGGLAGAYAGARIQGRLPEALIRRMVGVLVIAVSAPLSVVRAELNHLREAIIGLPPQS
jgi:uncharacterized membrane protein YfcA